MELTMRTATPAERLYSTDQGIQLEGQTGCKLVIHRVILNGWKCWPSTVSH